MSEMLAFVDVIVAPNAKASIQQIEVVTLMNRGGTQQYGKLSTLLGVHDALSRALAKIQLSFHSSSTAQVQRIQGKTVRLLSAREAKSIEDDGVINSSGSQILQGSPEIHKATRTITRHISFLRSHYSPVNAVVSEAARLGKYVPQAQIGDLFPLNSMIVELASCLEEKLVNISKSFPDQGVGFSFLLNNSYFIRERLLFLFLLNNSDFIRGSPQKYSSLDIYVAALFEKIEGYIESHLLVSWAPVLSRLFNPTPLCFGKHYSPLPKFESEFQKTYTTQKLWKVPDPELRKMLREAIIEKIIPVYRKYIEDNNVTTPKFTPQELEEMLQELFEG
ncbi:unnamed protein product [Miscanthus lutarioriparius]|uniref:Exocyst subunit Exo70 family protein n=1 Tax=Miscanthus lutarioriparius TaxID=422564 RepID=A0A811S9K1_9POAL|nr:unnamed protein product [Miscanthus lutarioriparius]